MISHGTVNANERAWSSSLLRYVDLEVNALGELKVTGGGGGGGAVTVADGADVAQGATTDAESAAGNGSVIALLKRIRTQITSLVAQLPAALTSAGNLKVSIQERLALTASVPAANSVGVASASALASNASRKAVVFRNTSNATISLGLSGNAAVLNSGITLDPGDSVTFAGDLLTTGQVFAIASAAASNLAIQEYT